MSDNTAKGKMVASWRTRSSYFALHLLLNLPPPEPASNLLAMRRKGRPGFKKKLKRQLCSRLNESLESIRLSLVV